MNYNGVFRSALATPGLLNTHKELSDGKNILMRFLAKASKQKCINGKYKGAN